MSLFYSVKQIASIIEKIREMEKEEYDFPPMDLTDWGREELTEYYDYLVDGLS